MAALQYPALYVDADAASNRAQSEFMLLVRAEYGLLVVAAILAMEPFSSVPFLIVYVLIFVGLLVLMLLRTLRRSDRDWYKCRALAESIKTAAWRYAMRAEPFDDGNVQNARGEFRTFLRAIFEDNQHIGHRIAGLTPDGQQITSTMDDTRNKTLEERKCQYLSERIQEQRKWYAVPNVIEIPKELHSIIKERVVCDHFFGVSEYIYSLIKEDHRRKSEEA